MADADRFEAFVRRYEDMVFGVAVRLLGDPSEAEDVAQTVFLRALERFETLDAAPAAGGWLRTVTTNLCLNHLSRFRPRWRLFSDLDREQVEGGELPTFEERLGAAGSFVGDLEREERQRRLEEAIRRLPRHQRVPLVLFHFEDRRYRDIAASLGVSEAKVKSDIHRGREALRRLLRTADDPR
jgi:RNA polymerase sigma-70 factor (ECF subfamily)